MAQNKVRRVVWHHPAGVDESGLFHLSGLGTAAKNRREGICTAKLSSTSRGGEGLDARGEALQAHRPRRQCKGGQGQPLTLALTLTLTLTPTLTLLPRSR